MGFLTRLFGGGVQAATPNNPRFDLNSPDAFDAFVDGDPASTGARVNRETALTFSPWWRGITLLSNDVGKLPLYVYRRKGQGRERATDHPAFRLLRRKPNPYQTASDFKRQLTGHAISGGNGYAYVVRDGAGRPLELLPLDPDKVTPVRADGVLWYVLEISNEETRKLPAEDVIHVKGFGYDGLVGYSVVDKAREDLGLGLGQRKFSAIYFKNSARPSVVLQTPQKMQDKSKASLREGWERMHAGVENAHRTAVLDCGLEAKVISFSAEDSQLLQSRQFSGRDVANFLMLPPHKVGDPSRTAYASLEQENLAYLMESLDPWLVAWEDECHDKLLTEEEKATDDAVVEFHRQELLRADRAAMAAYNTARLGGAPWGTINEARADDGLDPDGDPESDKIPKPLNIAPGGGGPGGNPDRPPRPKPQEPPKGNAEFRPAALAVLSDGVARMTRRVAKDAERAAKDAARFMGWLEAFEGEHRPVFVAALDPAERACAAANGEPATGQMADWLLSVLRLEYSTLADQVTPARLLAEAQALGAGLESRMAEEAARVFLGPDEA